MTAKIDPTSISDKLRRAAVYVEGGSDERAALFDDLHALADRLDIAGAPRVGDLVRRTRRGYEDEVALVVEVWHEPVRQVY